jgi:hypothetical protein
MAQPRFVLLHSPLLGPSGWRPVAGELARRGIAVETPAWPVLSSIGEDYYASLAGSMADTLDGGDPPTLVAHSGAGALMPALAGRLRTPAAGVIFADAILPHPGKSWLDTAPPEMRERLRAGAQMGDLPCWDAWWPPGSLARLVPDAAVLAQLTSELDPLPLAYFEAAAPTVGLDVPPAYLQLSGAYDEEARSAGRYGWPVVRLPLHHLAMLTHPTAVAAALESLGGKLAEDARA